MLRYAQMHGAYMPCVAKLCGNTVMGTPFFVLEAHSAVFHVSDSLTNTH